MTTAFEAHEIPLDGWYGLNGWTEVNGLDAFKAESKHVAAILMKMHDEKGTKFVLDVQYSDGKHIKIKAPGLDALMSAWFTPAALATKLARYAFRHQDPEAIRELRVLEPSAGEGAIVQALIAAGVREKNLTIMELDRTRAARLELMFPEARVLHGDCLELMLRFPNLEWDIAVSNPPYDNGLDTIHMSALNERVPNNVALVPINVLASKERYETLWTRTFLYGIACLVSRPKHMITGGESAVTGKRDSIVIDISTTPNPGNPEFEWWADWASAVDL